MLFAREQVVPWKSRRIAEAHEVPSFPAAWAVPLALGFPLGVAQTAQAASSLSDRVGSAFSPLVDLAQAVGYPICFLMVCGGFLSVMCGRRDIGIRMIKDAALGYIGLQFAPAIMSLLATVAQAMRESTP